MINRHRSRRWIDAVRPSLPSPTLPYGVPRILIKSDPYNKDILCLSSFTISKLSVPGLAQLSIIKWQISLHVIITTTKWQVENQSMICSALLNVNQWYVLHSRMHPAAVWHMYLLQGRFMTYISWLSRRWGDKCFLFVLTYIWLFRCAGRKTRVDVVDVVHISWCRTSMLISHCYRSISVYCGI